MRQTNNFLARLRIELPTPTSEESRESRLRRKEIRRLSHLQHSNLSPPAVVVQQPPSPQENPMPRFGCFSIQGLSETMDDAWFVKDNVCKPAFLGATPLHFFAVYDGHRGSQVSNMCKACMHTIMGEELERIQVTGDTASGDGSSSSSGREKQRGWNPGWEDLLRAAIEKSFQRMDSEVTGVECRCGETANKCSCVPMCFGVVGSTALVALLTPSHIVVANCGDSRAVLCRGGRAIPLSVDHKPERPDEFERIRAAGEDVAYEYHETRVNGLDVSRCLGNRFFKRVLISQPEITFTKRVTGEDECLILASDGIWDVMSDHIVCEVATSCLQEEKPQVYLENHSAGESSNGFNLDEIFQSKTKFAATMLCRMALARGSRDNISTIVVDLRNHV